MQPLESWLQLLFAFCHCRSVSHVFRSLISHTQVCSLCYLSTIHVAVSPRHFNPFETASKRRQTENELPHKGKQTLPKLEPVTSVRLLCISVIWVIYKHNPRLTASLMWNEEIYSYQRKTVFAIRDSEDKSSLSYCGTCEKATLHILM